MTGEKLAFVWIGAPPPSHLGLGQAHLEAFERRADVFAPASIHPGPVQCLVSTTLPAQLGGHQRCCNVSIPGMDSQRLHCIYVEWLLLFLRNKQEHQNLTKHRLVAFLSFPLPAGSWVFGPAVFMFPCSLLCFRRTLTAVHVWKLLGVTSCISGGSETN